MMEGRKRLIWGMNISRMIDTRSANRKGKIPLKMVARGISGATPFMTKTFMPTGGVITPISETRVIIMPNQMG